MKRNFWTKKNVSNMNREELVMWYNKSFALLQMAKEYKTEALETEKIMILLTAELKKRQIL